MLVATFGPSTAWAGRTITSDNGSFMLQGHGPVSAADVMEYDRLGHLIWPDEGTRAWVGSRASVPGPAAACATPASRVSPQRASAASPASVKVITAATFKFTNYDGGLSPHPQPEPEGRLVLPADKEDWQLHWGSSGKFTHGGLPRYAFEIEDTGLTSCRVAICDVFNDSQRAAFDLPWNAATELETALRDRKSGVIGADRYKFLNYGGGMSSHPRPVGQGVLVLPSDKMQWRLCWEEGSAMTRIYGGLANHTVEATDTGPSSCRVVIREIKNPSEVAAFELPENSAADIESALAKRQSRIAAVGKSSASTQRTAGGPARQPPARQVSFGYATYLGGHPQLGRKRSGNLFFTTQEVGIGTFRPKAAVISLSQVASVEVSGGQVATSKVGAEIMFGVLGGLGAKNAIDRATITLYTTDNQVAYYQIDKKSAAQVRAGIAPILRSASIPFQDEAVAATQQEALRDAVVQATQAAAQGGRSPTMVDELAKLAQLHESGALSDDEFATLKAKLIAS